MINSNNLFQVNVALKINYYEDFIIPYSFNSFQKNLIVTIFNSDNINQKYQGLIIPFSEYDINGQLEYFGKEIYTGNTLLQVNTTEPFKLKFRPNRNGLYFISIDEITSNITTGYSDVISSIQNSINTLQSNLESYILYNSNQSTIINSLQANSVNNINPVNIGSNQVTVLNTNNNRLGFFLKNIGNQTCYLKLGSNISTANYDYTLTQGAIKELTLPYTSIVTAICAANRTTTLEGYEFIST